MMISCETSSSYVFGGNASRIHTSTSSVPFGATPTAAAVPATSVASPPNPREVRLGGGGVSQSSLHYSHSHSNPHSHSNSSWVSAGAAPLVSGVGVPDQSRLRASTSVSAGLDDPNAAACEAHRRDLSPHSAPTPETSMTTATTAPLPEVAAHERHNRPVVFGTSRPELDVTTARLAVTLFLNHLCHDNRAEPVLTSDFHSHRLPPMSVENYVERIVRYSLISGETLMVSLLLLLRYSCFVGHPVSVYNVHRLLITSALLGIKMRDDMYYSNEYYGRIGGIGNAEINKLELRFCTQLEWDMWIDESSYEAFAAMLIDFVGADGTALSPNETDADVSGRRAALWAERLTPWKAQFEADAIARRARHRSVAETDRQSDASRGRRRHLTAEDVTLPAVFGRGAATVVNVPAFPQSPNQNKSFGILERAVLSGEETRAPSASAAGISIHAKPYYYKSGAHRTGGGTRHQQHRVHRERDPAPALNTGGWIAQTAPKSPSQPTIVQSGNTSGNYSAGNAAMRFTMWRAPNEGTEGTEGFGRRGGKKRSKPEHYKDYR